MWNKELYLDIVAIPIYLIIWYTTMYRKMTRGGIFLKGRRSDYMRIYIQKKISMLAELLLLAVLFTGCGKDADKGNNLFRPDPAEDMAYIRQKGTLVVGLTDFAPLDYRDGDSWVGFDAELAAAFAGRLGVDIEYKEIDWDRKTEALDKGEIDLIWNGMTRTDELENSIACSKPYLSNAQVIVMRREDTSKFTSADKCANLLFSCEKGSTAEAILKERKYRYNGSDSQKDALKALKEGKTDVAVVDMIMAASMTGESGEFSGLGFDFPLNEEVICVGLRKGSDLKEEIDAFFSEVFADETIYRIADQYGLRDALIKLSQ